MSSDVQLIVAAIEGLHSTYVKDYILPIGSVLVSGGLGAGVAYYTVNKQEYTKIELDKIKAVNKTLLSALTIRSSLIGIKSNYFGMITEEPINRMLGVPPVLLKEARVDFDLPSLSFITEKEEKPFNKWSALDFISTIISNFNTVIKVWEKRNQLIEALMPKLADTFGKPLNFEQIQGLLGVGNMALLSDLTERCLHMTDDLLVEISCFLVGFSQAVKGKIDSKILKKFGGLITTSLPTYDKYPQAVDILTKVPSVNCSLLSKIQGRPVQELQKRYRPIYK
ncbi:hypothetical protein H1X88_22860 [Vibrio parahaemolyticus]|uniref:hypothetical protein n=1 Tax=Vibrio parahaemolyticus TaxID=670 RepID=UPI00111EB580|nr:hypothetical protein [Vibrio parahaemolyticus]MBC8659595.1 hypothetical protein [Vibrio parahaemolyticus]TOG29586.1 hypothetical protein CGJ04_16740 [Vibrio parahaemolyticus]